MDGAHDGISHRRFCPRWWSHIKGAKRGTDITGARDFRIWLASPDCKHLHRGVIHRAEPVSAFCQGASCGLRLWAGAGVARDGEGSEFLRRMDCSIKCSLVISSVSCCWSEVSCLMFFAICS